MQDDGHAINGESPPVVQSIIESPEKYFDEQRAQFLQSRFFTGGTFPCYYNPDNPLQVSWYGPTLNSGIYSLAFLLVLVAVIIWVLVCTANPNVGKIREQIQEKLKEKIESSSAEAKKRD